ncbi:hypothetical protein PTQ49_30980, partial [Klebsiella pasteurii]|nr:hypothetical protein [Klebsiella pasteurii]
MNFYYDFDIEAVFNWVKEDFILKHSASLVNNPWYDYDIEIDLRLVKQALMNGNFEFLYVVRDHGTMLLLLSEFHSSKEGANKRGNSSRLTQSFHFFMFEPI